MTDDEVMLLEVRLKLAEAWQRPANMADCPQYCKTAVAMQVEIDGLRELIEKALRALEYHKEQTRPIYQSDVVIGVLRKRLGTIQSQQENIDMVQSYDTKNPYRPTQPGKGSNSLIHQRTTPTAKQMDAAMALLYKKYKVRDDSLIRDIVKVLTDT